MFQFAYIYILGSLVFFTGVFYAFRQGYLSLQGKGLRNLSVLLFTFAFFLFLQGYLQFADMSLAEAIPYKGGADDLVARSGRTRGSTIDYIIMGGYFVAILAIGTYFGRKQKSAKDFFFGGQKFSWWLVSFSLVATVIGSYSFVKYSSKGFDFGLSSSQTYFNDWMWLPLFIFGWLPIFYFSRITSVPEYFGKRFGKNVRLAATVCLLVYLVGYVGVNLFTMGKVLNALVGWPIPLAALGVAVVSATYVTAGGQTSVIMTDLFQGVMLLLTGGLILYLGIDAIGGVENFWEHLPRENRMAFPNFNEDAGFPSVGIFWQDAIANSAMFYFLNQGIMMRFMAARSVHDGRKAFIVMVILLMTVAAMVVGGGGWVAKALVHSGHLPPTVAADQAFYVAMEFVSRPGVFGLVLAALTAALMSTVDTLITAIAAVCVNDLYVPYKNPSADESEQLKAARVISIAVTVLGVLLVPLFMMFNSIYDAHGAFTAAVTPPLVVALLLSVFWKRFTKAGALSVLLGGLALIFLSILFPDIITPFAQGVPMKDDVGDSLFAGMKQYKYMRACFGIGVCSVLGVVVSLFTQPESKERQSGLVWGTVSDAVERYKGRAGTDQDPVMAKASARFHDEEETFSPIDGLPGATLSKALAETLGAEVGDLIYISDARWYFGGLRSGHTRVTNIDIDDKDATILLSPILKEALGGQSKVSVYRFY